MIKIHLSIFVDYYTIRLKKMLYLSFSLNISRWHFSFILQYKLVIAFSFVYDGLKPIFLSKILIL